MPGGVRAMVLAAGRGLRLRPLTDGMPKPLLPVLGRPLVELTLDRLEAAGIEAVGLNLHHLAADVRCLVEGLDPRVPVTYSPEPELLGTLGALHPLRDFLGTAELVLVVNGDTLCEWPFRQLIAHHRQREAIATLLLTDRGSPDAFGAVQVDEEGRVICLPGGSAPGAGRREHLAARVFAGAQVISPELVRRAPGRFSGIVKDLYLPMLAAGERIESVTTDSPWHDLGTPRRYLAAVLDWAARSSQRDPEGNWIASSARVDGSAELETAVVEHGARLEARVKARSALVLQDAVVGRESSLTDTIVGPGVELPARSAIVRRMVTPAAWGTSRGCTREKGVVLTPLGSQE